MEARCKDKFLVQTVTIRADQEVGNVASIVRVTPHTYDKPRANYAGSGQTSSRQQSPPSRKRRSV